MDGANHYDTDTARWTAKDPIGMAGGDSDWYGYCLDDPVNGNDPEGLKGDYVKDGVILNKEGIPIGENGIENPSFLMDPTNWIGLGGSLLIKGPAKAAVNGLVKAAPEIMDTAASGGQGDGGCCRQADPRPGTAGARGPAGWPGGKGSGQGRGGQDGCHRSDRVAASGQACWWHLGG